MSRPRPTLPLSQPKSPSPRAFSGRHGGCVQGPAYGHQPPRSSRLAARHRPSGDGSCRPPARERRLAVHGRGGDARLRRRLRAPPFVPPPARAHRRLRLAADAPRVAVHARTGAHRPVVGACRRARVANAIRHAASDPGQGSHEPRPTARAHAAARVVLVTQPFESVVRRLERERGAGSGEQCPPRELRDPSAQTEVNSGSCDIRRMNPSFGSEGPAPRSPLPIAVALSLLAAAFPHQAQGQRVGLALSGGAARGLAHIGVLEVLAEAGVRVDVVAGTSMGGVVGGLYAMGYTPAQLDSIVTSVNWTRLLTDPVDRRDLPVDRKFTKTTISSPSPSRAARSSC